MAQAVPTEQVFKLGNARVYTSPTLGSPDWTERPHLYCDSWREIAGPDIGGGVLRYDYGEFSNREADLFEGRRDGGIVQPLSILRHYVKIEVLSAEDMDEIINPVPDFVPEIEPVKTFYGRIDAVENESAVKDTGTTKTGTQVFTVYDLKVELADVILRTSAIEDIDVIEPHIVGQAIGFNISPVGVRQRHGNQAQKSPAVSGYAFSWCPSPDDQGDINGYGEPRKWTSETAMKYLLEYDIPKDKDDDAPINWQLGNSSAIKWYDIAVQREGRTALDVLNELIDRRRLVGYTLDCEEPNSGKFKITVRVFTFTDADIDMPGGNDLPANADTVELVCQTSPVTDSVTFADVATHQAEKVRVEGEPITVTMTFGWNEEDNEKQLVDGWKDSAEEEYVEGSGADPDDNTMFRLQDKYEDVFSRIVLSDFWNQKYTRIGGEDQFHACIPVDDIPDELENDDIEDLFKVGEESKGGPWWHRGHLFQRHLAVIDPDSKQYRPMFVLFQDSETDTRYHYAEKLNAEGNEYSFGCHVHTLPDRPGVRVKVNKAGGQQLIAKENWSGAGDTPAELNPDSIASVDYEQMLVTATMEWDARCYAEEVIDDSRETLREILIRVPGARLDIELPGCVTDLSSAGALVKSDGKVLRDDRQRLRDIAKAAAAWYGVARKAARLTYNDIVPIVNVGQFVTNLVIGATRETINTPVTGVAYDFLGGRCYVETSYADADFSTTSGGSLA